MHFAELTEPEQRVLGCLIEKRRTTPEQYPLSLNALRLACNQSTNREPVTDYDESTVKEAAQRLARYGLARLASGHGSRAVKYRHLAEDALGLGRDELAVLAVLLLRGPQTPGELKGRSERMAPIGSLTKVQKILDSLAERDLVRRVGRRPGQKEDRFAQLLGAVGGDASSESRGPSEPRAPSESETPSEAGSSFEDSGDLTEAPAPLTEEGVDVYRDDIGLVRRVDALEAELEGVRLELAKLRSKLENRP